jgi:hypothetical protein
VDPKETKEILLDVRDDIQDLVDSLDGQNLKSKVEIGSVLWTIGSMAKAAIEAIKQELRDEAANSMSRPGIKHFPGVSGSASVRIPNPSFRISKRADIKHLQETLGEEFVSFFEEIRTFQIRRGFESRIKKLDKNTQDLLLGAVDQIENTPRISFRRKDQVRIRVKSEADGEI